MKKFNSNFSKILRKWEQITYHISLKGLWCY